MNKRKTVIALVASASLILSACGGDDETTDTTDTTVVTETTAATVGEPGDVAQVVVGAAFFSTLAAALTAAGLVETLQGEGPFTVFAPTDDAFAALPDGLLDALLLPENVEILSQILLFHVVVGAEVTSDLVTAGDVQMASGDTATIVIEGETITIAGAEIKEVDVASANGVIHVINSVMVPAGVDVTALLAG